MPEATVDIEALFAALRRKRQAADLSWRDLAQHLAMSPSTFTRLAQGRRPDIDTFVTLLHWLSMPADAFVRVDRKHQEEQEPLAVIASSLRFARNVRPEDAETIMDVVAVLYRRLTASK